MKDDLKYGDEKSSRYNNIIKYLFQRQLGSGLDQYTELHTRSRGKVMRSQRCCIFSFHQIQLS